MVAFEFGHFVMCANIKRKIGVLNSLVFRRKDLCEARVKPEVSSYFQMRCTDKMCPPHLKLSLMADQVLPDLCVQLEPIQNGQLFRWSECWDLIYPPIWNCQWQEIKSWLISVFNESPFEMVVELGQVFRWSEQLCQHVRWSAHWDQIYPMVGTSCGKEQN